MVLEHEAFDSYGISFSRLVEEEIEIVRKWRNDPRIRQYMVYKEFISLKMQKAWFSSINNNDNYYFMLRYQSERIGLANLKNVNRFQKSAESGLFLYPEKYQNSLISSAVLLGLFDFGFEKLGLKQISGTVLSSNTRALRLNQSFGFESQSHDSEKGVVIQVLEQKCYLRASHNIRSFFTERKAANE